MAEAWHLEEVRVTHRGSDIEITGYPEKKG
jgi:hypothetical protein